MPNIRWNVWTNAGQTNRVASFYQIASDLDTDAAADLVELLTAQGWSANRAKIR